MYNIQNVILFAVPSSLRKAISQNQVVTQMSHSCRLQRQTDYVIRDLIRLGIQEPRFHQASTLNACRDIYAHIQLTSSKYIVLMHSIQPFCEWKFPFCFPTRHITGRLCLILMKRFLFFPTINKSDGISSECCSSVTFRPESTR